MSDKVTITLPKEEAQALMYYVEARVFDEIRNDPEADNIRWLRLQLDMYDSVAHAIGESDTRGMEDKDDGD